jgi:hypothetical protein
MSADQYCPSYHDDASLKKAVAKALADIIRPGATYPFSRRPIAVIIRRVDVERGEVSLDIGACRFIEGSGFAPFLEQELKTRIPQLRNVGVAMREI